MTDFRIEKNYQSISHFVEGPYFPFDPNSESFEEYEIEYCEVYDAIQDLVGRFGKLGEYAGEADFSMNPKDPPPSSRGITVIIETNKIIDKVLFESIWELISNKYTKYSVIFDFYPKRVYFVFTSGQLILHSRKGEDLSFQHFGLE